MIKIKNFFSKYWLFVLLAFSATILSSFYLKNRLFIGTSSFNEKLLSLPPMQIESYKLPDSAKIILDENNFPQPEENLEVYQTSSFSFSDKEVVEIAKKMGFSQTPNVTYDQIRGGNIYSWEEEQKSLTINLHWGTINYHQNLNKQNLPSINLSDGEKIAYQFLETNGFLPPKNISLVKNDLYYLRTLETGSQRVTSDNEADLVEIDFEYKINQKRIVNSSISIIVDFSGKITDFNYEPTFKEISLLEKYPLKSKNYLIEELKNKKAVSYLLTPSSYSLPIDEVQKVINLRFNQMAVVYYKYDSLQLYLQPAFLVTGIAILKDGQQATIGLYLPAIKDEYLLK